LKEVYVIFELVGEKNVVCFYDGIIIAFFIVSG